MNSTVNSVVSTKSALLITGLVVLAIDGCLIAGWAVLNNHSKIVAFLGIAPGIAAIVTQFLFSPVDFEKYQKAFLSKKVLHIIVVIFTLSLTPLSLWTYSLFVSHRDQKSHITPGPNFPSPKATTIPFLTPNPSPTTIAPTPSPTTIAPTTIAPIPSPTIQPEQGTPVPTAFENTSQWDSYGTLTSSSACFYENNYYHAWQEKIINALSANSCTIRGMNYKNIDFQVHLMISQGDCGGIIFRANSDRSQYYGFLVCSDGQAELIKEQIPSATDNNYTVIIKSTPLQKINPLNSYTIRVLVIGSNLEVYIDQVRILNLTDFDNSYTTGLVGVLTYADAKDTEVLFNNPVLLTR